MRGVLFAVVAGVCGCGCGEDGGGGRSDAGAHEDGGDVDGGAAAPDAPDEPAPPSPPVDPQEPAFAPCPAGWREVADADRPDVVVCDPFPEGGPASCAIDEMALPGEGGCRRVGSECPAGDYAEDLPAGDVLYVLAGAAPGGDGTPASPFARIADALAAAVDGAVVAVSKGTFDEDLVLSSPVTIWGACVAETILTSTRQSETEAVVYAGLPGGVTIRNLRITGDRRGVRIERAGAPTTIESVVVEGALAYGVFVDLGATLEATDLVVQGTRARPSDESRGYGLEVAGGSTANVAGLALERNRMIALWIGGEGTDVSVEDFVIRDTLPQASDDVNGYGVQVSSGAAARLSRGTVRGNRELGVLVADEGTSIALDSVVVEGTLPRVSNGAAGYGLFVRDGASADLDRVLVRGNRSMGILVGAEGTVLRAGDLVLADTDVESSGGANGIGLQAQLGAHVSLARTAALRNRTAGLAAGTPGSEVVAEDLVVRGFAGDPDGVESWGLWAADGGWVSVSRAEVESCESIGVAATGVDAVVDATDLTVRATREAEGGGAGNGVEALGGGRVTLSRAAIEENVSSGLLALSASEIAGTDVVVRSTLPASDDRLGFGVECYEGSHVSLTRAILDGNRTSGAHVLDEGSTFDGTDLLVQGTEAAADDGTEGHGLAIGAATATLLRARFEGNRTVAIVVQDAGRLQATDLTVVETRGREIDERGGYGLELIGGSTASIDRARFADNRAVGVGLDGVGTALDATDLVVEGTMPQESDGTQGYGLIAQFGARATIARARIAENRMVGLVANGSGATITVEDLVVERILVQACSQDGRCPREGGGIGVAAVEGGTVAATRFRFADSVLCGVQIASGGAMDLVDGEVARHPIGANIQDPAFDVARIQSGVVYVDNETTLDASALPVPSPVGSL